jgi:hypothetical protein
MFNISVIFLSRMRPIPYQRVIDSCLNLADFPDNIEILCKLDYDDTTYHQYISIASKYVQTGIFTSDRKNGYLSSVENSNLLGRISTGKILMNFNDDAYITAKHWDSIIMNKASEIKDDIFDFTCSIHSAKSIDDHTNPVNFPIISRKVFNIIGMAPHLSNDIVLATAFRRLNRCFHLSELSICHDHVGTGGINDIISKEGCLKHYNNTIGDSKKASDYGDIIGVEAEKVVEKLRPYITKE